jgi:hypothetical protein
VRVQAPLVQDEDIQTVVRSAERIFAPPLRARLLDHFDRRWPPPPHLTRLTTLDLRDNDIGEAGARALAASPHRKGVDAIRDRLPDDTQT